MQKNGKNLDHIEMLNIERERNQKLIQDMEKDYDFSNWIYTDEEIKLGLHMKKRVIKTQHTSISNHNLGVSNSSIPISNNGYGSTRRRYL